MPMHFKSESAARAFLGIGSGGKAHGKSSKGMNKTEAAYGDFLLAEQLAGNVVWFEFKPPPFRLSSCVVWNADFLVQWTTATEWIDVKGTTFTKKRREPRPLIEPDAAIKLHWAASLTEGVVKAVYRLPDGRWAEKVFKP